MPRVLLLFEYPSLNGGERSLLAMLPAIQAAGYQLTAAAPNAGPLAEELDRLDLPRVDLAAIDAQGTRLSQLQRRERLAEICQAVKPDVVHANSLSMARLAGPVLRELHLPSIGHLRDILKLSRAALNDLNCHTRLLAVSAATREFHVRAGLDAERVEVLYNGVDLARFAPRAATGAWHTRLGLPCDTPLVGSIGQIGMRKGLDVTLAAFRQLVAAGSNAHWIVVGERHSEKAEAVEYEADLRDQAAATPLTGRVHFVGNLPDVAELLNELSVLIHAARQEPLGRVLLEAAAAGTPVLATDVGGTAEIFPPPAQAARLLPKDDPAGFAAALAELLTDLQQRQRLSQAARAIAEQRFDARQAGAKLVEHYQAILRITAT